MDMGFDRRSFLGKAAIGGLAATAVTRAVGAEEKAEAKPEPARVVVGVMGMGGRGTELARQFAKQPGVEVAYVCCADKARMEAAADVIQSATGKAPRQVGDFRRILDDKSVDVLVCAAPNHWHGPATILACTAGKHVYVEKPCCHTPREGELQVEAARKYKRIVQVGTQRRSWPGLVEGIQKLRDGAIGAVRVARGWYNNIRPTIGRGEAVAVPDGLDYDLWQGPAPRREFRSNYLHYNWHWFWHWGNGEIGNNGVHAIDVCRWGLGVDYPKQVTSSGMRLRYDDDQETPDTHVATYQFDDKMIIWEGRSCHPRGFEGNTFGAAFYGDGGTMVADGGGLTVFDLKNKQVDRFAGPGGDDTHVASFLEGVRTGAAPTASIDIAVASTQLCHLGAISHRVGRNLRCDPSNGHILNDDEAAALWNREYAPGWEPKV
jgi:predicted dehydrogenase